MSARKKNRLSCNGIVELLEEEDFDDDTLNLESSISKFFSYFDKRAYSLSDSNDDIALPTN